MGCSCLWGLGVGEGGEPGQLNSWNAVSRCLCWRGCPSLCQTRGASPSFWVTLNVFFPVTSSCCHGVCHEMTCLWSACRKSTGPCSSYSYLCPHGCSSCHTCWLGVSLPGLISGICCLVALACVASTGVGSPMPVWVGLHLASSESWEPGKEKIRTLPWSEVAL